MTCWNAAKWQNMLRRLFWQSSIKKEAKLVWVENMLRCDGKYVHQRLTGYSREHHFNIFLGLFMFSFNLDAQFWLYLKKTHKFIQTASQMRWNLLPGSQNIWKTYNNIWFFSLSQCEMCLLYFRMTKFLTNPQSCFSLHW